MKNLSLSIAMLISIILATVQISSAQVDSTCNYNYITQQRDAFYDSIISNYGDSALEGTGYKSYIRWRDHMYFRQGSKGDLFAHEQYIEEYFEGVRNISGEDGSDWSYFGPKGIFDSYTGSGHSAPANGKGMMLSLYVYPDDHDKILAGSHNSGLWETVDEGITWQCLTDSYYKIKGVNSIIVDQNDPNTICISTFNSLSEVTNGLYYTTDGGTTWSEMNNGINSIPSNHYNLRNVPRKLIIRPGDEALFYLTHSYLYRANDFNTTWEKIYDSGTQFPHWFYQCGLFDIEFDQTNDSIIYISGTGLIIKSEDDGNTWQDITYDVVDTTIIDTSNFSVGRTEICTNKDSPNSIWFCCTYADTTGNSEWQVIRYDNQKEQYYAEPTQDEGVGASIWCMEFEIDPTDTNLYYTAGIRVRGFDRTGDSLFKICSGSGPLDPHWIHVDIREMKILKHDSLTYRMYLAHDGGISWADMDGNSSSLWTWDFLPGDEEHGLDVYEFYDFTCLDDENDLVFGGTQDLSGFTYRNDAWHHFGQGDGGETVIDTRDTNSTYIYYNIPGAGSGSVWRSTNFGEDLDNMFYHTGKSLFTALSLHPFNETELYYASDKMYYWPDARNYDEPQVLTAIDNDAALSDVEIMATGSSITKRIISSQKAYGWPYDTLPSDYKKCLWVNNYDRSAYLYGDYDGYITDIEINPDSTSEMWLSFGWATKSDDSLLAKKIYRSNSAPGNSTSWVPFVEGFPEGVPVRKLLYDHKYNQLYCASDIGVWVRDLNVPDNEWVEFNNNLPFKIVTDLEILYSQNVIRAATYGRGIWESPIYCYYDAENPYIVEGTEVWTEDRIMSSDIIIPDSARLTIRGCKILMPTDAKIVVEHNAKLYLDSAHLSNACDHLWRGIEVLGDPSKDQIQQEQGFVKSANGTIIEHAHCAINAGKEEWAYGYGGGILNIDSTIFRNNKQGIVLWPYQDAQYTTITNCTFETTKALFDIYNFECFIGMAGYTEAIIKGCTFVNSRPEGQIIAEQRGIGILSNESQFILTNYEDGGEITLNSFSSLRYGVKALNITTLGGPAITHCQFDMNLTGVYFSGISDARVTECSFGVDAIYGQESYTYCGLYLDNSTGYHVEANEYYSSTYGSFRPDNTIGITVNNSGGADNEIYRNYFDNLDIGILAQNSNRNFNGSYGLVLKCNDFGADTANWTYDIAITAYGTWPYPGIKKDQGDDFDPSAPAGNMFSHKPPDNDMSDYYNETTGIYYYQHIPNPVRLDMEDYNHVTIGKEQTQWYYNSNNSCLSMITKSEAEIKTAISESKTKADSVDLLLDALVDGGNTPALENDVILSTPPEAYTLHNDLMNKSPYLTDTVMIEAVKKEDVLSPVMVKEILVANPQAAKSEEVMTELDNRVNPLPNYMISEIEAGKDSLGDKELMEASKSYFRHRRAINLNMLKSIYKFDTIGLGYSDSLVALLEDENSVEAKYELAYEHIKRGEYTIASAVLNNIPNQFILSNEQLSVHQKYDSIMPIIADLYQNYKSVFGLDSSQIDVLNSLVADSNSLPGIYARNILVYTGQLVYNEPYILPDTGLKAETVEKSLAQEESTPPRFKVYPNPAGNYINVEYNLEAEGCDGFVLIRDNLGKTIKAIDVRSEKYSVIIPSQELTNGIYLISLVCNEELQATEKVIIQH